MKYWLEKLDIPHELKAAVDVGDPSLVAIYRQGHDDPMLELVENMIRETADVVQTEKFLLEEFLLEKAREMEGWAEEMIKRPGDAE